MKKQYIFLLVAVVLGGSFYAHYLFQANNKVTCQTSAVRYQDEVLKPNYQAMGNIFPRIMYQTKTKECYGFYTVTSRTGDAGMALIVHINPLAASTSPVMATTFWPQALLDQNCAHGACANAAYFNGLVKEKFEGNYQESWMVKE